MGIKRNQIPKERPETNASSSAPTPTPTPSSPSPPPPCLGVVGAVASLKSEKYGWASIIHVVSLSVGLQFPCLGAIPLALTPSLSPSLAAAPASALVVCALLTARGDAQALPMLHPLPSFRVLLNALFSLSLSLSSLLSCICCVLCACLPLLGFAFVGGRERERCALCRLKWFLKMNV